MRGGSVPEAFPIVSAPSRGCCVLRWVDNYWGVIMKRVLLGSLILVAAIWNGAGFAADMATKMPVKAAPVAPAWNWSGFYVGGHFGYGWAFPEITSDAT